MKHIPVILYPHEVRAALEGRLTQIWRPIKPQPPSDYFPVIDNIKYNGLFFFGKSLRKPYVSSDFQCKSPFGQPGDRLVCKETWTMECNYGWQDAYTEPNNPLGPVRYSQDVDGDDYFECPRYKASEPETELGDEFDSTQWRSPVTMPQWASRITLVNNGVGVRRVQDITYIEAKGSGVTYEKGYTHPADIFKHLWNSHYAKKGFPWEGNCWCWIVDVKVVERGE